MWVGDDRPSGASASDSPDRIDFTRPAGVTSELGEIDNGGGYEMPHKLTVVCSQGTVNSPQKLWTDVLTTYSDLDPRSHMSTGN